MTIDIKLNLEKFSFSYHPYDQFDKIGDQNLKQ